ncbi:hypothetical protein V7O66_06975 [Methanolobus sp. ZRKC3]|uniref:COG1361 S-layer family protein n=1 Tax=Methanolobus sp. ZRKC3 TaxID=3125786 RepID=UPI00325050E3
MKLINAKNIIPLSVLMLVLIAIPVHAEMSTTSMELPEFFNFDENYYTVYGGPDVTATLIGDNEFSRGDEVALNLNLMNKGVITGFKDEEDDNSLSTLEQKIQQTEMGYEAQRTTAIGIVAILTSDDPNIKVKSGQQEAGTLFSGEQTENPVRFNIEVSKNAPAGEYPLNLNLFYGYQENVQVNGDDETDLGITNMEVGLWYAAGNQMQQISIIVEKEADFDVVNVTGDLEAGEEGLLRVVYKNVGEEEVKDATVRISADDPFSTTDDQSFLGSIAPGETSEAVFKLKVDGAAVSKMYAINSEIKYEDMDGHSQISDTIKIQTETLPAGSSGSDMSTYIGIVVVLVILGAGFMFARNFMKNREGDN